MASDIGGLRIGVDRFAQFTIAYMSTTGRWDSEQLQVATLARGGSWRLETLVDPPAQEGFGYGWDSAVGADGTVAITWSAYGAANRHVNVAVRRRGIGGWNRATLATGASASVGFWHNRASVSPDGSASVAWVRNGRVHVASLAARGAAWTFPSGLSLEGKLAYYPSVAVGGDGSAIVVWHYLQYPEYSRLTNPSNIGIARRPGRAAPWVADSVIAVRAGAGTTADVAVSSTGRAVLAYVASYSLRSATKKGDHRITFLTINLRDGTRSPGATYADGEGFQVFVALAPRQRLSVIWNTTPLHGVRPSTIWTSEA